MENNASEILLYVYQRQETFHIRNLSIKLQVSSDNAKRLLELYDLLNIDKGSGSEKIEKLLKKSISICKEERHLKGCDINDYYSQSLQTVTNRYCKQCGKTLEGNNRKAMFCSGSCRVVHHREKVT